MLPCAQDIVSKRFCTSGNGSDVVLVGEKGSKFHSAHQSVSIRG